MEIRSLGPSYPLATPPRASAPQSTQPVDGFTPGPPAEPRARLEQVVDTMMTQPPGFFERRTLLKAARGIGPENMEKLAGAGVRIKLLDGYSGDSVTPSMRAEYLPSKKLLQLSPGRFTAETLRHELGHALDDLAEADEGQKAWLHSEKDPTLQGLYEHYKQQVEESSWWSRHFGSSMFSDYATHNVHEYLAEGIMLYTGSERKRHQLQASDPGLHGYLGEFLKT